MIYISIGISTACHKSIAGDKTLSQPTLYTAPLMKKQLGLRLCLSRLARINLGTQWPIPSSYDLRVQKSNKPD